MNAGMEFAFRSLFSSYRPRVTQAYVEVTYRRAADSTVYIGGVYEKKSHRRAHVRDLESLSALD